MNYSTVYYIFILLYIFLHALIIVSSEEAPKYWTWISGYETRNVNGKFNLPPYSETSDYTIYSPGARSGPQTWMSSNTKNVYIFGGDGYASSSTGLLQDLWQFDVLTKHWTWMTKSSSSNLNNRIGVYGTNNVSEETSIPGSRWRGATWIDDEDGLWMFGGEGYPDVNTRGILQDLWWFRQSDQHWIAQNFANPTGPYLSRPGVYTTPATSASIPGSRMGSGTWRIGNRLYLFGGVGVDKDGGEGYLNDLWYFDLDTKLWNFVTGSTTINRRGVYNTKGEYGDASLYFPGARAYSATWVSNDNKLYIFGGNGYDDTTSGFLNDLWAYDIASNQWAWISGSKTINERPNYGLKGEFSSSNIPGSRYAPAYASANDGKLFYLFGGESVDSDGTIGNHNDLWEYDLERNEWRWVSGSNFRIERGTYGTMGSPLETTVPGIRRFSSGWHSNHTFYLFGGYGTSAFGPGFLNDMWLYDETYKCDGLYFNETNVCSGQGNCTVPEVCSCNVTYSGSICQYPVCFGTSSDDLSVCSTLGECIAPDTCTCNVGYGSENCSLPLCNGKLSNETTEVCSGHGSCENPEVCNCSPGYTGLNCEYSICEGMTNLNSTVCSGRGSCDSPDMCTCSMGYAGNDCEFNICNYIPSNETSVCSTHGDCIAPDTCICDPGYTGDYCQYPICYGYSSENEDVCSGQGDCTSPDNCECNFGYMGDRCQYIICNGIANNLPNVCSNHGTCPAPDTCNCYSGYFGEDCQYPVCFDYPSNHSEVCSSHGICTAPNTCDCIIEYGGDDCEFPFCNSYLSTDVNVCSTYGACVAPDICVCDLGHNGTNCELFDCFGYLSNDTSFVCSNHGSCIFPDTCDCNTGYTDMECSTPICFGIPSTDSQVCSTHGNCSTPNTCICEPGFGGPECQYFNCYGYLSNDIMVCSGNGMCSMTNTCVCDVNYFGEECNIPICHGILANNSQVCSSQGECIEVDTCACNSTYQGDNCEFPICFGTASNEPTACSGRGVCVEPDTCTCQLGYHGSLCDISECYGMLSNSTLVCSGHGTCLEFNECICDEKYHGDECDIPDCYATLANDSLVCSSNGICLAPDECICNSNYFGDDCSVTVCNGEFSNSTNVCSTHGECIFPDNCNCHDYYWGPNCDEWSCFERNLTDPAICSAHGQCIAHDTCTCDTGYGYIDCSMYTCFDVVYSDETVCNSHGICTGVDTCVCYTNYSGDDCNDYFCNGIIHNSSNVCSSHGVCVAHDTCSCTEGYHDWICSNYECFNISYNHSNVCNSEGNCTAPDMCDCTNDIYYGSECKNFSCFDIDSSSSEACNGHGDCVDPDTCICNDKWIGDACSLPTCFGIPSNSSDVCHSHGVCSAPDNCSCIGLYTPPECEIMGYICFNLSSIFDHGTVCSGNGECIATDKCECKEGYFGDDCSSWTFNLSPSTGYVIATDFSISLPPDVSSSSNIVVSFIHPFTLIETTAIHTSWNTFILDVEGQVDDSYNLNLIIQVTLPSSTVKILSQVVSIHPLKEYCNALPISPLCSPILNNYITSYFDITNLSSSYRILEGSLDAIYDCNKWRSGGGTCEVQSLSYPIVNCYYPLASTGFCNIEEKSCICHSEYSAVDCSLPKVEVSSMQLFQTVIINYLNSLLKDALQSQVLLEKDLFLASCIVNDLHVVTYSQLESVVSHLELILREASLLGYNSNVVEVNTYFISLLSKLLDIVYVRAFTSSLESKAIVERIYTLTHEFSEVFLQNMTLGEYSTVDTSRISIRYAFDASDNIFGSNITAENSILQVPSEISSIPDSLKVTFHKFFYNIYQYKSATSTVSETYSVRFYSINGTYIPVINLSNDSLLNLHIYGEWNEITSPSAAVEGKCIYWDTLLLEWSSSGCAMTRVSDNYATCSCNHTTDFSIMLTPIADNPIDPVDPIDPSGSGPILWRYIIIGSSVLLLLLFLCCLLCLLCMCFFFILLLCMMGGIRLKTKKIKKPKKIESDDNIDYFESSHDNSGSVLLSKRDVRTFDSIGEYAKDDLGTELDEDSYVIPELKDYLNKIGTSSNPSEVDSLKKKVAEVKEKYRRRKELDEMKSYLTTLMTIDPSKSAMLNQNLKLVEELHQGLYSGNRNPPKLALKSYDMSDFESQAPAIKSAVKLEDIKMRSPVLKKQVDQIINDRSELESKTLPERRVFKKLEKQFIQEKKPHAPEIDEIEIEIEKNFEQISKLQLENQRKITSDAIIKLKFQNKLLNEKVHKVALKLGLNPDTTRLRRQIENLRKQYQTNVELIRNLEEQLNSTVLSEAETKTNVKSQSIESCSKQLQKVEVDNALLIKEGNSLMREYFLLKKKNRDWTTTDVKHKHSTYDDYYTDYSSTNFKERVKSENKLEKKTLDTTFQARGEVPTPPIDTFTPKIISQNPFNNLYSIQEVHSGRSSSKSSSRNANFTTHDKFDRKERQDRQDRQNRQEQYTSNQTLSAHQSSFGQYSLNSNSQNLSASPSIHSQPSSIDTYDSHMNRIISMDTPTSNLFSTSSTITDVPTEIRTIRGKINRIKQQIVDTKAKFKQNQVTINELRLRNGDSSQISALDMENQLLVQRIAQLAQRYKELRSKEQRKR